MVVGHFYPDVAIGQINSDDAWPTTTHGQHAIDSDATDEERKFCNVRLVFVVFFAIVAHNCCNAFSSNHFFSFFLFFPLSHFILCMLFGWWGHLLRSTAQRLLSYACETPSRFGWFFVWIKWYVSNATAMLDLCSRVRIQPTNTHTVTLSVYIWQW